MWQTSLNCSICQDVTSERSNPDFSTISLPNNIFFLFFHRVPSLYLFSFLLRFSISSDASWFDGIFWANCKYIFFYFSALKPHGGNPIKSITLEDVQKLFAEAETQGYQVMVLPPPEKPPQNQTGGVVGSSPATGKRLIAKSTQSQLYSELLDHDHSPNEIEQQPNG